MSIPAKSSKSPFKASSADNSPSRQRDIDASLNSFILPDLTARYSTKMSIKSDENWQVGNANFALIMMRYRELERQQKMVKLQPKDTAPPEQTTKWREIVKAILGIIAVYITIMVLVGVMR